MKLAKYISILSTTILFFVLNWILVGSVSITDVAQNEHKKYIWVTAGIIALIAFTCVTFSILSYSLVIFLKSFKDWKSEKGLWKILNVIFKIAMFVFAILITIFWLVWFIGMLKDGFKNVNVLGESMWESKIDQFAIISKAYIGGGNVLEGIENLDKLGLHFLTSSFGLYVTSFVFIIIWGVAGIVFEVLKKVLGGNRPSQNEPVQA